MTTLRCGSCLSSAGAARPPARARCLPRPAHQLSFGASRPREVPALWRLSGISSSSCSGRGGPGSCCGRRTARTGRTGCSRRSGPGRTGRTGCHPRTACSSRARRHRRGSRRRRSSPGARSCRGPPGARSSRGRCRGRRHCSQCCSRRRSQAARPRSLHTAPCRRSPEVPAGHSHPWACRRRRSGAGRRRSPAPCSRRRSRCSSPGPGYRCWQTGPGSHRCRRRSWGCSLCPCRWPWSRGCRIPPTTCCSCGGGSCLKGAAREGRGGPVATDWAGAA
mmetsp:Transcript_85463/g.250154  ORF Transcript_85463/g.250154 Transcript_85463/m.250154 type:complete len:277 (+) Transcript_85463:18-848(+)